MAYRSSLPPSPPQTSFLSLALKVLLVVSSLVAFSFAAAYLYPFLLPVITDTVPQLWTTLQTWFTAPVLFVLMNLVVGAVFVTSGRVRRTPGRRDDVSADETDPREAEDRVDEAEGLEVRPAKFSVRERLPRIVRSKSDVILPPKPFMPPAAGLMKFPSSSESAVHSTARAGGPPEDDPASEEVDQKAEDFIGSFYQKLKLQRLDSITRYQGWINRSHGPPGGAN